MEAETVVSSWITYGARIRVRAARDLASSVRVAPPPHALPYDGPEHDTVYTLDRTVDGGIRVLRDDSELGRFLDVDSACRDIESDQHFRVAIGAKQHLFVHAGVVVVERRAMVFPGRTLAGKSTLVLALVRAGARYYSDEYAVFDKKGHVHPYRKPLSERLVEGPPRLHSADSLDEFGSGGPVPLDCVVVTRYRQAGRWRPKRVSRADGLMALFDNTVLARECPEFALAVLTDAIRGADVIRGDRGEASVAARALITGLHCDNPDLR